MPITHSWFAATSRVRKISHLRLDDSFKMEIVPMPDELIISPGPKFKTAMLVAIAADALQLAIIPLFAEGALSPADDILDMGVAVMMFRLLGWHWEFLPTFAAKLIPGVDLVPFWTIAVASVWRKAKATANVAVADDQKKFLPSK